MGLRVLGGWGLLRLLDCFLSLFGLLRLLLWLLLLGLLLCCLTAAALRDDSRSGGRGILGAGDRRLLALSRRGGLPCGCRRLRSRTLRGSGG